jgi:DUF1009 family protein
MGWARLGLIAGGGALPIAVAGACVAAGQNLFVARLADFAEEALTAFPGETHNVGAFGARKAALKAAGCDAVVMAGIVTRPDFARLAFDAEGLALAPRLVAAARQGDDALMRVLIEDLEASGFTVIGTHEAAPSLLAPLGALGAFSPGREHLDDIAKARAVAAALGAWDVGQAVAVCAGLVLAVEAQEGTDAMIARVASLPGAVRGSPNQRRGVLVKAPKPIQDRRIDLPVIGAHTIAAIAAAGLAGVAVEADGALILERDTVVAAADAHGLFVYGFQLAP